MKHYSKLTKNTIRGDQQIYLIEKSRISHFFIIDCVQ